MYFDAKMRLIKSLKISLYRVEILVDPQYVQLPIKSTRLNPCMIYLIFTFIRLFFKQKKIKIHWAIEQSLQLHQPSRCHSVLSYKEIEGYMIQ